MPFPTLAETRVIETLGREIAALDPLQRGPRITRLVQLWRRREEACPSHLPSREEALRRFIHEVRLSVERQSACAQIGPRHGS